MRTPGAGGRGAGREACWGPVWGNMASHVSPWAPPAGVARPRESARKRPGVSGWGCGVPAVTMPAAAPIPVVFQRQATGPDRPAPQTPSDFRGHAACCPSCTHPWAPVLLNQDLHCAGPPTWPLCTLGSGLRSVGSTVGPGLACPPHWDPRAAGCGPGPLRDGWGRAGSNPRRQGAQSRVEHRARALHVPARSPGASTVARQPEGGQAPQVQI